MDTGEAAGLVALTYLVVREAFGLLRRKSNDVLPGLTTQIRILEQEQLRTRDRLHELGNDVTTLMAERELRQRGHE